MNKYEHHIKYEQFEYEDNGRQAHRQKGKKQRRKDTAHLHQLHDMDDGIDSWEPSYVRNLDPQHHERQWVIDSLAYFYTDNIVSDVMRLVKGGKEANVYLALGHADVGEPLIAAKLYRPRMLRNLRNDAIYKIGRQLRDEEGGDLNGRRERLAMRKNTRFGQWLDFEQWIGTEYAILQQLYDEGADVPKPIGYYRNTLLMRFIGSEYGAAPTLSEVAINSDEAPRLYKQVMENVELMLSLGHIHGDLSAYNILYWEGEITLIDFPQMITAHKNPHAFDLLLQDVERVCDYFGRFGIEAQARPLTDSLWEKHVARIGYPPIEGEEI